MRTAIYISVFCYLLMLRHLWNLEYWSENVFKPGYVILFVFAFLLCIMQDIKQVKK